MQFEFTERFKREYKKLSSEVRKQAQQQFQRLLDDPTHPSLRVKRVQGTDNIWEASVNMSVRFTFHVRGDSYVLRTIGDHKRVFRQP